MNKSYESILSWVVGQGFTTTILSLSGDIFKAFILGVVGGLGGLAVKIVYEWVKKKKMQ